MHKVPPIAANFWRTLILNILGGFYEKRYYKRNRPEEEI